MPVQPEIIYDSAHIRVLHRRATSPFALITFSHATKFVNGTWFWGDSIAAKAGLEAVGVVANSPNWFPVSEMERAAGAIRAALRSQGNIIGFGTSMGGYGALKHGRLLGMTHSLAFVPQWSIDPADVQPWDQRFIRHFDRSRHHAVAIAPGDVAPKAAIFYDPFMKLDRLNFEQILLSNPQCTGIKSYFTAHSSVITFKGTEPVVGLLGLLLAGDFASMQQRANDARRDKQSEVRPLTLAQLTVQRNISQALRIADTHRDKLTSRQKAALHHDIACMLYAKACFEQALPHSITATTLFSDCDFEIRRSMIEQKLGYSSTALTTARRVVDQWPGHPGAHLHLATLLVELNDADGARTAVLEALRLSPLNKAAQRKLASLS